MMKFSKNKDAAKRRTRRRSGGSGLLRSVGALLLAACLLTLIPMGAFADDPVPEATSVPVGSNNDNVYAVINGIATIANSNDLADYIDGMKLQKKDANGNWVDLGSDEGIVLGNNYKLSVHFEAGSGGFENPMHWSLGNSVKCTPVDGAPVWDGNKKIGTYTLDEDGNVTVTFMEEFLNGTNQKLDMEFEMVPTKNPDSGGDKFPWEGEITGNKVVDNTAGLDVEKTAGYYSSSQGTITYTVEASCTAGLVSDGKLDDRMTSTGLTFNGIESMTVYDANGRDVTSDYQSYIDKLMEQAKGLEGKTNWTLGPLPPLSQGMRFEVKYKGKLGTTQQQDPNYVAKNTVTFSGKMPNGKDAVPDTDTAEKNMGKDQVAKTGNTVVITGADGKEKEVIQWTVRVGSGQWDPFQSTDPIYVTDTLGSGLSFETSQPIQVTWCDENGNVKGSANIDWSTANVTGNKVQYDLTEGMFGKDNYNWEKGDYLSVTYYTDYDPTKQPTNGFVNTVKTDITADPGVTGVLPVGEAIQKTMEDNEDEGYLEYQVVVDVPPARHMSTLGSSSDEAGHEGQHYFYIEDRLDSGDDYFAVNVPEIVSIQAESKSSKNTWDFREMPCTSGTGDSSIQGQTYQIVRESEEDRNSNEQGKEIRAFRIFFNVAKYGVGNDNVLDRHDSIWDIDEATRLTITYRIPYNTPVVDLKGDPTGLNVGDVLNRGLKLDNLVYAKRSGVTLEDTESLQKRPENGEVQKNALYLGEGVVEYRVSFVNSKTDKDSRLIKNDDNSSHYNTLKPTFSDTFDDRMEYVDGSLYVEVRNKDGNKIYAIYKYTGNPVSDKNTLTAKMYDNSLWSQTYNDKDHGGTHYDSNNTLTDTFDTTRTYVFIYRLQLKEEYRKDWLPDENIHNTATLKYGDNAPSDEANINIPSDMLQKDLQTTVDDTLLYTLHVNDLAVDLVTGETGEGFVNLGSYKLVDHMSENLTIVADKTGNEKITVQYKDAADGQWKDLERTANADSVTPESYTYFRAVDSNGDLYFILPDQTAITITYECLVDGAASSKELATNTATLYADHKESDERKTLYEIGVSSAHGSSDPVVRLQKVDAQDDTKTLPGAEFTLYSNEATGGDPITVTIDGSERKLYPVGTYTTDQFGEIKQITPGNTDGKAGLYALVETKAPNGYTMTDDPIFFRFPNYEGTAGGNVKYEDKEYTVQSTTANHPFRVENPPEKNLQVVKTDAASDPEKTDYFLGGAEFELHKGSATGEVLYTGTSREAGGVIEWKQTGTAEAVTELHLDEGTYFLVETDAPEGYIKLADPVQFKVDANGNVTLVTEGLPAGVVMTDGTPTVTITIPNQSGYVLPESGGMGTTVLYALGAALVLSAAMALVCDSRRRRAKG